MRVIYGQFMIFWARVTIYYMHCVSFSMHSLLARSCTWIHQGIVYIRIIFRATHIIYLANMRSSMILTHMSLITPDYICIYNRSSNTITMTSYWTRWCLKSQASRLFTHSGADQRKHQSSASLAFVRGIHRWPVNSPHKGPVTRKMFPFDDIIMVRTAILYPVTFNIG